MVRRKPRPSHRESKERSAPALGERASLSGRRAKDKTMSQTSGGRGGRELQAAPGLRDMVFAFWRDAPPRAPNASIGVVAHDVDHELLERDATAQAPHHGLHGQALALQGRLPLH
jgi:hypothetical protein